jgi:hypothetical protein
MMEHENDNGESISPTSSNLELEALLSAEDLDNILERLNLLEEKYKTELIKNNLLEERLSKFENNYLNFPSDIDKDEIHSNIKILTDDCDFLMDKVYNMECRLIHSEQYSRRESLVISNIPESIVHNKLEGKVLEILREIGLKHVSSYDIAACHRLKKNSERYPANTVVRFVSRKLIDVCYKNKKNLINCKNKLNLPNLRIFEHLCDANQKIYNECKTLKRYDIIDKFFTWNGSVKIIKTDSGKVTKINHIDELFNSFPDFYS